MSASNQAPFDYLPHSIYKPKGTYNTPRHTIYIMKAPKHLSAIGAARIATVVVCLAPPLLSCTSSASTSHPSYHLVSVFGSHKLGHYEDTLHPGHQTFADECAALMQCWVCWRCDGGVEEPSP